jgi:hypothetical protein
MYRAVLNPISAIKKGPLAGAFFMADREGAIAVSPSVTIRLFYLLKSMQYKF